MGKSLLISLLLLTFLNKSYSQITKENKKLFLYSPLRTFFQQDPSLTEIEIYKWEPRGCNTLNIKSADTTLRQHSFDLCFEGDKYLFEKKFGKWNFPDSLITPLIDKKTDDYHITINIRYDSIFVKTVHTYYPGEDSYFFKIRDSIWYIKGMVTLEKELQAGIKNISSEERLTDSVFYFTAILARDSTITVDKQITSENKTYAKALTKVLNKSFPWQPFIHGGIKLKFYLRIYIKINEDKSVRAAIRQP